MTASTGGPSLEAMPFGYSGPLRAGTPFLEDVLLNVRGGESVTLVSASARTTEPGVHVTLVSVRQARGQFTPGGFLGDAQLAAYHHVAIAGLHVVRLARQFPDMSTAGWIVERVVFDRPGAYRLPPATIRYKSKWRTRTVTVQDTGTFTVKAAQRG